MAALASMTMFVRFRTIFSFVLLASLPFHRFDMSAHGDCKFRDEWLVQDKYKEWVVKDGDPSEISAMQVEVLYEISHHDARI